MSDEDSEISSEIYSETNFSSSKTINGTTISRFSFIYPNEDDDDELRDGKQPLALDQDGDVIVRRKRKGAILIEHQRSTDLSLVGLQVWRGALLLADFLFHNRNKFVSKHILEVGSGVGLTSIAAAIFCQHDVICTDINLGGILNVIGANVKLNCNLMQNRNIHVMELDFKNLNWSKQLKRAIGEANVILAADVIYDNNITDDFVQTLVQIFDYNRSIETFIALEKRYIFTISDLDTTAPCYEYFLQRIADTREFEWKLESIAIDSIPHYFDYKRSKELVLLKLYL